jgi:lipoate-protein ligase A
MLPNVRVTPREVKVMLRIINESFSPYFNLALEEFLLKEYESDEELFVLWQNSPAIIIGRNQNAWDEINHEFVSKNGVAVVRRLTGGGAVYHDLGNLNFTFIARGQRAGSYDFARFARPIIEALVYLGVKAEFSGRNDIAVAGRKVSGNAQYRYRDSVLHHGTLLFDSNMENLVQALNVSSDKLTSKGVASVRSRVANIKEYLPVALEMGEFKAAIGRKVLQLDEGAREHRLTEVDLQRIGTLERTKYATRDWNYGASPGYGLRKSGRFDWGKIEILLNVRDDRIADCKIYGDFFGRKDISGLEKYLVDLPLREADLKQGLDWVDLSSYVGGLDRDSLVGLLCGERVEVRQQTKK